MRVMAKMMKLQKKKVIHELFRILCFEFRVCSIDYFLDEMQDYEVNTIIQYLPYLDRNSWEQNRFSIYANVQMNSKQKIKPTDILKFAWDNTEEQITITSNEIERLKNKSKEIFNTIKDYG